MFIWNHLYCNKNVTFWSEGTFARTALVQEAGVFSKWTNSKSLGKVLFLWIKLNTFDDRILFSELAAKM